jgi:hypothetical protein
MHTARCRAYRSSLLNSSQHTSCLSTSSEESASFRRHRRAHSFRYKPMHAVVASPCMRLATALSLSMLHLITRLIRSSVPIVSFHFHVAGFSCHNISHVTVSDRYMPLPQLAKTLMSLVTLQTNHQKDVMTVACYSLQIESLPTAIRRPVIRV